jgi:hypothetical protein
VLFVLIGQQLVASPLFDKGLKAANEKNYPAAIVAFEEVIETEKGNASAYYNLGNCYYNLRRYGKAIWAYEKVLKLSPRDPEAPMNLELCYKKLGTETQWTPHTSGLQRLIYGVRSNTWAILAIVISLALGLTIFYLFKLRYTSWKRLLFMLALGETVLIFGFIAAASGSSNFSRSENFAIVTDKSISTFLNDQGEHGDIKLTEGTKVEVISITKTKLEVMLQDGRKTLVSPNDISRI